MILLTPSPPLSHPTPPPQVPLVDGALQPVVNIVPLQLLSYHLTLLRGYNVDQPRNLAKSVTVTEEVRLHTQQPSATHHPAFETAWNCWVRTCA